ncbi:MAG: glycine zipper 2TM domain-containing protein [Sphingomonas sp.]|nr:glycine zipper 2TM domain-containing protein [Sphingomonas sp.]
MFRKSMLAMSAISMVAVPAVADAHHYNGYGNGYGYEQQGYYPQQGYYGQEGYYPQQAYAYGNRYYGRSYGYRNHRCSGTTGTIVGAGAGALLGRSIGRGSGYDRNSGTTGTIIGAALGALVGREVGKSTC